MAIIHRTRAFSYSSWPQMPRSAQCPEYGSGWSLSLQVQATGTIPSGNGHSQLSLCLQGPALLLQCPCSGASEGWGDSAKPSDFSTHGSYDFPTTRHHKPPLLLFKYSANVPTSRSSQRFSAMPSFSTYSNPALSLRNHTHTSWVTSYRSLPPKLAFLSKLGFLSYSKYEQTLWIQICVPA